MNAVEYIQEHVDPLKLLEHYGFRNITEHDDEIRACCEIHKGNNPNAFIWNKKNNFWYCYTGADCGGGDTVELIRKMEGVSFQKAVTIAAELFDLNIEGMEICTPRGSVRKEQELWLRKQRKRIENKANETEYELPFTRYTSSHPSFPRFDNDIIDFYGAKFCTLYPLKESYLRHKLVIPMYFGGVLSAVALRDTTGRFLPKWMYMPKGFKAAHHLYNIDRVSAMVEDGCEEAILVEGIFDVWSFHRIGIDNVMAIFGSHVSDEQYKQIMRLNVTVTLCFDNDAAGRKCTVMALKKFKSKTAVKRITLPERKDPGDCTKEELMSAYLSRT